MLFVRTSDLKPGMRLARPVYNKNGVMLYERDSKLTMQGVVSIQNFGLIGIYILEPAEPLPPMSEDDIAFERYQTMAVFSLRDIFDAISKGKRAITLPTFVSELIRNYGQLNRKINFLQNVRSTSDAVYKHSLNTAILAAMISHRMRLSSQEQIRLIMAALLHQSEYDNYSLDDKVKRILLQFKHILSERGDRSSFIKVSEATEILLVAYYYDQLTAMKLDEEPQSEVEALRYLSDPDNAFLLEAVNGLVDSINILTPGVCVQLTNGERGVVLNENTSDVLRPTVLCFENNKIRVLSQDSVYDKVQIHDIMKSMDNRFLIDRSFLEENKGKLARMN
ncbi:MAG: hypothetical protein PWP24_186 [Clostridiales bacterium]|nr:hypothetical protein [Clostridiales bacterium]